MARIILIHGAWGNGASWARLVPLLGAMGHDVEAPDLPSHGHDETPPDQVGQAAYVAAIEARLLSGPPAILVGHSMGGIVIAQLAARQPDHVLHTVYVAALLPRDGDSLVSLIRQQDGAGIQPAIRREGPKASTTLDAQTAAPILFADADARTQARAMAHMSPQPNKAQTDPAQIGPDFDRVPRAYVFCTQDLTVTHPLQQQMVAATPCAQTFTLDCGHVPQLTQAKPLADILNKVSLT